MKHQIKSKSNHIVSHRHLHSSYNSDYHILVVS